MLPDYVRQRPKNPMSYSIGLHERARLYKPLFARLHRSFGYDLQEPVRRDFDTVLSRCGNDLDRAIADGRTRPDYTVLDTPATWPARPWNAAPMVRRLVGPRPARHSRSPRTPRLTLTRCQGRV